MRRGGESIGTLADRRNLGTELLMKVVVLFDGISALGKSPDLAILETVEAVEAVLTGDGHDVVRIPVNPDARWVERVRRGKPDLAFNLCGGLDGGAPRESNVTPH